MGFTQSINVDIASNFTYTGVADAYKTVKRILSSGYNTGAGYHRQATVLQGFVQGRPGHRINTPPPVGFQIQTIFKGKLIEATQGWSSFTLFFQNIGISYINTI
jgi:hypothetical protein